MPAFGKTAQKNASAKIQIQQSIVSIINNISNMFFSSYNKICPLGILLTPTDIPNAIPSIHINKELICSILKLTNDSEPSVLYH